MKQMKLSHILFGLVFTLSVNYTLLVAENVDNEVVIKDELMPMFLEKPELSIIAMILCVFIISSPIYLLSRYYHRDEELNHSINFNCREHRVYALISLVIAFFTSCLFLMVDTFSMIYITMNDLVIILLIISIVQFAIIYNANKLSTALNK